MKDPLTVRILSMGKVKFLLISLLTLLTAISEASSGISYHGRILRPNSTPVNSATTQFRIQIRTPGTENCLLWEEQQTKDLSNTNGVFSLTIADTSEPSLIANTLPFTLERVFSNRTNFSGLTGCSSGSVYNPSPSDGRSLQVLFREAPSDPWEQMPLTKINFVPMALNTVQLQGYLPSEFLKVDSASSYTPLTATQVNTLMDIIAGTNTQYLRPSTTFSGDVSGTYNTTSVDKIKGVSVSSTAPTNGQILKLVGGVWTPAAETGTATDASYSAKGLVQVNTDQATSGLYIASGVLAMPNVITAGGPTGGAQTVPVITYDQKGRLTAVSTATVDDTTKLPLAGGTMTGSINMGTQNITNATSVATTNVSTRNVILADNDTNTITVRAPADVTASYNFTLPATGGTAGHVLSTDGSGTLSWIAPATGGLSTADYNADVAPAASCTTSQTPYWNTVADTWACQNIKVTGAGAFFVDGGNSLGAAATLGTNDNFGLNFETNGSNRVSILADGTVGIGTTTPAGTLFRVKDPDYTRPMAIFESSCSACNVGPLVYNEASQAGSGAIVNFGTGGGGNPQWSGSFGAYRANNDVDSGFFFIAAQNGNPVERMRIDDTGQVGIGTNSPGSILDITGAFTQRGMATPAVSSAGQGRIYFDSTSNKFRVSENGGGYTDLLTSLSGAFLDGGNTFTANATLGTNSNHALSFETNGTDRMTILANGNIGIGTASPSVPLSISANYTGLQVVSAQASSDVAVFAGNPNPGVVFLNNTPAGSTSDTFSLEFKAFNNNPAEVDIAKITSGQTSNLVGNHAGYLSFSTTSAAATAERMRITETGRVGIGTTAPTGILHVDGGTSASGVAGIGITLKAQDGNGAAAGSVSIQGGTRGAGTGASITVDGGLATEGGGSVSITAGNANNNIAPGNVTISTGSSANIGGGMVTITTGQGNNNKSGNIFLVPGTSGAAGSGDVHLAVNSSGTTRGGVGIGALLPTSILDINGAITQRGMAAPAVSAAGQGRIYFDSTSNTFKISQNGGAYTDLVSGGTVTGSGTVNAIPKFTAAGTVGDSALTDNGTAIIATRAVASTTNPIASGASINLATSNTHTLASVGGSTITISGMQDGGLYNIVVEDTNPRTYTFSGCTNSYFKPANASTQSGTRSVYGLLTVKKGANWDCYVTWSTGFQ